MSVEAGRHGMVAASGWMRWRPLWRLIWHAQAAPDAALQIYGRDVAALCTLLKQRYQHDVDSLNRGNTPSSAPSKIGRAPLQASTIAALDALNQQAQALQTWLGTLPSGYLTADEVIATRSAASSPLIKLLVGMPAFKRWLQQGWLQQVQAGPEQQLTRAAADALWQRCRVITQLADSLDAKQALADALVAADYAGPLLRLIRRTIQSWPRAARPSGTDAQWPQSLDQALGLDRDLAVLRPLPAAVTSACQALRRDPALAPQATHAPLAPQAVSAQTRSLVLAPSVPEPEQASAAGRLVPQASTNAQALASQPTANPLPPSPAATTVTTAATTAATTNKLRHALIPAALILVTVIGFFVLRAPISGPSGTDWVILLDSSDERISFAPASFNRAGRAIYYQQASVNKRLNTSSVALISLQCDTGERRTETTHYYSSPRFDPLLRYEVKTYPLPPLPASGRDADALRAACAMPG